MTIRCRFLFLSLTAALAGCATVGQDPHAVAHLQATQGNAVTGTLHFEQHQHGMVKVYGQVSGLKPNTEHGFHVHETGDCSSPDGSSAGGHFNPSQTTHGKHGHATQHAGDMMSLRANAQGVATVQYETAQIRVGSGSSNVVGRALIVHADPDDFTSQPAGNAGARLACGVIQRN